MASKPAVKKFRELGVEKLEDSDVVELATGKVFRQEAHELHEWELPPQRHGIERELVVVRKAANPRLVLCEYRELESRRTCLVNVRDNRKFFKGMVFKMEEPAGELEFVKAWEYKGKLPRRRGRW